MRAVKHKLCFAARVFVTVENQISSFYRVASSNCVLDISKIMGNFRLTNKPSRRYSKNMIHKDNKRDAILRAAGDVVLLRGAEAMTLEAVAAQAEVSKGGLLHHFPSKQALVEGMIESLFAAFESDIETEIARDEKLRLPVAGRFLRAYVRMVTTPDEEGDALSFALLAAATRDPSLLRVKKGVMDEWQHRAENDGIDRDLATVIRLAADGCWMSELFGFEAGYESPHRLKAVQNTLLRLINEAAERAPDASTNAAKTNAAATANTNRGRKTR